MDNTLTIESPVGPLYLHADKDHLTRLSFTAVASDYPKKTNHPILRQTVNQLTTYFDNQSRTFDLPVKFNGTDFQNRVWRALMTIPHGQTQTYGDMAQAIKNPKAVRAVGMANNKNPIVIIVPCHRVIGAGGQLVGYGGGLPIKTWLLNHEKNYGQ
ncbi:MAG: methylated-DNA--[protein]-cysteine S-methyltransferase [Proteobacteria bacterium]|nr:methylated-DNA--[protein]-cysteine S-methyltransferase [Pseudomonadota bacterium]